MGLQDRVSALTGVPTADLTVDVLQEYIDDWYCTDQDYTHSILRPDGTMNSRRGEFNDRGDEATIRSRALSVSTIGIVQQRLGPWLIASAPGDNSVDEVYHWASLLEGVERCVSADSSKKNVILWKSIARPLKHSKRYDYRMPEDARKMLKFLGSQVNDEVTEVTILEKYRASEQAEVVFAKAKDLLL